MAKYRKEDFNCFWTDRCGIIWSFAEKRITKYSTKKNDEDICNGKRDEIVVHGTVKPLALDNDNDDREVTKEATDEDHNIEYCEHVQQHLQ